ncbi:hypothetical protein BCR37DRAFT_387268 [Protomyces lactucae-debilis]|uniref:Uncharacterized protein n=1 Tax=Protomyces lactucae-debilis TaxID=2754530 RepID=A0A1Y2FF76_PROLT|nr:uncharacterized protein BCR37DRAFT_387268 [Protomyces lactucae-debilis]ORY82579.1 hypothetical protein BCR37DRAFT_387268 [Protomyces lactucae-debilis]
MSLGNAEPSRPHFTGHTLHLGKAPAPAPSCIKSVVSIAPKQRAKTPFARSIRTLKRWKAHLSASSYADCEKSTDVYGFVQLEEQVENKRLSWCSWRSSAQRHVHVPTLMELFRHTSIEQVSHAVQADASLVQRDDAFNRRWFDQLRASRHERL